MFTSPPSTYSADLAQFTASAGEHSGALKHSAGLYVDTAAISFILAGTISIFNYVLALVGALCFARLALSLPGWLWLYSHGEHLRGNLFHRALYGLHVLLIRLGLFLAVGAAYGLIVQMNEAYADGSIPSAFSCVRNSGFRAHGG